MEGHFTSIEEIEHLLSSPEDVPKFNCIVNHKKKHIRFFPDYYIVGELIDLRYADCLYIPNVYLVLNAWRSSPESNMRLRLNGFRLRYKSFYEYPNLDLTMEYLQEYYITKDDLYVETTSSGFFSKTFQTKVQWKPGDKEVLLRKIDPYNSVYIGYTVEINEKDRYKDTNDE